MKIFKFTYDHGNGDLTFIAIASVAQSTAEDKAYETIGEKNDGKIKLQETLDIEYQSVVVYDYYFDHENPTGLRDEL